MLTVTHTPSSPPPLPSRTRVRPSPLPCAFLPFPPSPFPPFLPSPPPHSLPYKEVLGKIRDGERPITVCFQKHAVSFGRRKKASSKGAIGGGAAGKGAAGKGGGVAAAAAAGASKGRAASASGADDGSVVAAAPRMTYRDRVMLFQNTLKTPSLNMNVVQSLAFEGIPDYGEGTPGLRSIYWMILLGYLPLERDQWGETLKTKHQLYAEFKADLIAKPSHGDGESKEGGGGGGGGESLMTAARRAAGEDIPEQVVEQVEKVEKDVAAAVEAPAVETPEGGGGGGGGEKAGGDGEGGGDGGGGGEGGGDAAESEWERVEDDPLNQGADSQWNAFFLDKGIHEEIFKDVRRTLPGLHYFNDEHYLVMERILFIFAKLNPGVKYVQGMNEVLGPLYYILTKDRHDEELIGFTGDSDVEADTFFCFSAIMSEIRDIYIQGMDGTESGMNGSIRLLDELLKRHDNELWTHLTAIELDPQVNRV